MAGPSLASGYESQLGWDGIRRGYGEVRRKGEEEARGVLG